MSAYFQKLTQAVTEADLYRPALVVDTARLAQNLSLIRDGLPKEAAVRVADKSLPSLWLLRQAFEGLNTRAIMSFHLPITRAVMAEFPDISVLMGKPMPVSEVARFLTDEPRAAQVTWLIDSAETAKAYRHLSEQTGTPLRVAFEVDIGLGRGGFLSPDALAESIAALGPLIPVGLMGYEAHVNALPAVLGRGAKAAARSADRLRVFLRALPPAARQIINTGGSTTVLELPRDDPANDVTVGSLIVKPSDFDQAANAAIKPAMFIVTPVLKTHPHGLPGHPELSNHLRKLRIIGNRICFTYGGKWMANPVYPAGLGQSPFYGPSSNQQGFVLPRGIAPPKSVVFRPTQSEAVIQHFPSLWLFDGEKITGSEQPMPVL